MFNVIKAITCNRKLAINKIAFPNLEYAKTVKKKTIKNSKKGAKTATYNRYYSHHMLITTVKR